MDRIASGDVLAAAQQIAGAVGVGEIDRKDHGEDGDEEIVNLTGEIESAQSTIAVENLLKHLRARAAVDPSRAYAIEKPLHQDVRVDEHH